MRGMITFVTNSLTGGGAERAINLVSDELCSRGLDVAVIAINSGPQDIVTSKAKIFELERGKGGIFSQELQVFGRFLKVARNRRDGIFILNCNLPEFYGIFLPFGSKIIVVEHANPAWHNRKILGFFIRQVLLIRRVHWVKVSDHFTVSYLPKVKSIVIQNPIKENLFHKKISTHESGQIRLAFVGRLESFQKRPRFILELSRRHRIPAIFIGDGPERESLEKEALMFNQDVSFLGHVKDPWAHLYSSDLLVVPSVFEGDGLVVVEAILRSQPILLNDITDFRRFQLPEKHYFTNLIEASLRLKAFIDDQSILKPSAQISDRLRRQRSLTKVGDDWLSLIKKIS